MVQHTPVCHGGNLLDLQVISVFHYEMTELMKRPKLQTSINTAVRHRPTAWRDIKAQASEGHLDSARHGRGLLMLDAPFPQTAAVVRLRSFDLLSTKNIIISLLLAVKPWET